MLIGPVFSREVTTAARRARLYVARAGYALGLLFLIVTAYLVLTGTQLVRDVGDLARFGTVLFQLLAPLQFALAVFFAAVLAAGAVSQEKDRRTLVLLLLTNLSNCELVLGKLLASLLSVLVMLAAALPVFMLVTLLGGVSYEQIARVFAVTVVSVLACGSLGSTVALWREKTFQALAMTVLVLVLWLAIGELIALGLFGATFWGLSCKTWAVGFSPWQAVMEATRPQVQLDLAVFGNAVNLFLVAAGLVTAGLNGIAVVMVRVWNPSRESRRAGPKESQEAKDTDQRKPVATSTTPKGGHSRRVWDNPILWREIRTWAYGRKILLIRLAYLALFALAAGNIHWMVRHEQWGAHGTGAVALVALFLLSLVLVNAQAVTALTSERDGRALDLLLVTDLTPREFIFGKLGGIFYNCKEIVLLPMFLCGYLCIDGVLSVENLVYLLAGFTVLYVFVAVLGIHAGMSYVNSRSAFGTSLGTVFFLFVGVATFMRMMLAFSGSFQAQFPPFFAFMVGGGVALYVALGARNPSPAIGLASFLCPIATFYCITSFLIDPPHTLGILLVMAVAYGFTTAAMLVPAIYEFDVVTGRTTIEE